MVISFLVWLLIALESAVFGNALYSLIQFPFCLPKSIEISFQKMLLGFVSISTLASFLSLFFPLSSITSISTLLVTLVLFKLFPQRWRFQKPDAWLFSLAFLIFLFALETATRRPLNSDTNLYHAQAIHWIESYPAVFGLGNLHGRLAFNSVWFITNAFYSFSEIFGRSLHLVSGSYFVLFCLIMIDFIKYPKRQDGLKFAIAGSLLLLSAFQYLASDISSPSTDVPAALSVWLVFLLTLSDNQNPSRFLPILLTALATFAVVIKLSALPILLIPAIYLFRAFTMREKQMGFLIIIVGVVIVTPFLIRNLILSGYLIYPFPSIDLFNFVWKVPIERAIEERDAILVWGRLPKIPIKDVLDMPIWVWFPKWFSGLTLARKGIVIFAALSPAFLGLNHFVFKATKRDSLVHGVFISGVYFWMLSTPDIRFGYSFVIPAIILNLIPFTFWVITQAKISRPAFEKILFGLLIIFIGFTFIRSIEFPTITQRWLFPRDYDRVKTQECQVDGVQIFCSVEYNACSYLDFPCVPQQKDWVRLLGNDLEDGFYGEK